MTLFCSGCGFSLQADANYCSACGKSVIMPGTAPGPETPVVRPRSGRKIAGVCQGLANHYGWDVTLTRVIAVLLAVCVFPVGLVAYLLFWVMLPEEPQISPVITTVNTTI
jgi:phage shock protein C